MVSDIPKSVSDAALPKSAAISQVIPTKERDEITASFPLSKNSFKPNSTDSFVVINAIVSATVKSLIMLFIVPSAATRYLLSA